MYSSPLPEELRSSFRAAMRGIASTVCVVTAGSRAQGHGMTVTAITSVTLDPPALLVCINKNTLLYELMRGNEKFCVNVLASEHADISAAFSGGVAPEERFLGDGWDETEDGLKYLRSAQACIVCRRKLAIPFGTHEIFIGEVSDLCSTRQPEAALPLVYRNATYCTSTPLSAQ